MLTITIHDTNTERYTYTASANVLGRRYDNIAEYVSVVKPESETGRDCIMIVTYGDTVVDHIPVGDTPIAITSNLSQYASVKIGFAFLGADGYIKNSEVKQFYFLTAQKPDGFVPLPPEQKTTIDYLISHGFTGAKLENNILSFTNAAGNTVVEIKLSGFIQEQADWNETNTTAETYIKNKPTKLSQFTNDSGFVTSETFTAHTGNKNNPHGVTAEQTGAYVKPTNGIPESDLSEEVQAKLNSGGGGGAENLLKQPRTVNVELFYDLPVGIAVLNFNLGLIDGGNYKITYNYNGEKYEQVATAWNHNGIIRLGTLDSGAGGKNIFIIPNDESSGIIVIYDKYELSDFETGTTNENASSLSIADLSGASTFNAEFLSLTKQSEIIADKVKNPLKITVNGEEKTYDGSGEVSVDINTGGGGGAKNLLKGDVTMTYAQGTNDGAFQNTGYTLGLEEGKQYTVVLTHNTMPITATGKVFDLGFGKVLMDKTASSDTPVGIHISDTDNLSFLIIDNSDMEVVADNCVFFLKTDGATTTIAHTVVFKSITEVEEVVADKLNNALTLVVGGQEYVFDGTKPMRIDL